MVWRIINFPAEGKCGEPLGEPVRRIKAAIPLFKNEAYNQTAIMQGH